MDKFGPIFFVYQNANNQLFDYKITFLNSQREDTDSNRHFVFKTRL